ncbi:MAG: hypothetical protein AAB465_00485 [Patescibacteria group bacterium]
MNFNEFPKNWLPTRNWEEVSRQAGENQITIRLRHINPEINIAPELTKGYGEGKSISESESIAYHGISTRRGSGMKDFFEGMTKMAESGLTSGVSMASVQNLKNQYQKADVDVSGKYDSDAIITIAKFSDEKSAKNQMLSFQILPTQGFTEMPIPGMEGVKMSNLGELLKSDYYKSAMKSSLSKEQMKQLEKGLPKMQEVMEKASKQIKEQYKKLKAEIGAEYYEAKYLGFPAAFVRTENLQAKQYPVPRPVKSSGTTIEANGGGCFDPEVKLPPQSKVKPSKYTEMCQGIRVNNFVIFGNLLTMMATLPSGSTFCHSLTKTQTKIETEKIEGKIYRTTHILPVNSVLAQEGYLNKEETEKIFKTLFSLLQE